MIKKILIVLFIFANIGFCDTKLLDFSLDSNLLWSKSATVSVTPTPPAVVTNNFVYSENFVTANWAKARVNVTAGQTPPTGVDDAFKFVGTAQTDTHSMSQNFVNGDGRIEANTQYTTSIYAKIGNMDWMNFRIRYTNAVPAVTKTCNANFNVNTGATGTMTNLDSFAITDVGGGWYRISATSTSDSDSTWVQTNFFIAEADTDIVFTGDGSTTNMYLTGAMHNEGALSDYVKTE